MSLERHAASPRRGPVLGHTIRKIAIVRALFLGDLLMTTPAWRALRRRFPRAEITLIGLPWAEDFVARVPHLIDRFVPFVGYEGIPELPYDAARTAAWLDEQRAYGYDLAVQMHGDGSVSNGLVAELGAWATLGFARPGDHRLDVSLSCVHDRNEVVRWLDLVATIGARAAGTQLDLRVDEDDDGVAAELIAPARGRLAIGMHIGAKDPARRWPARQFAALGAALQRLCGATIVLTGGAHERELAAEVAASLDGDVINLAGDTHLGSFAALVRRLDLLVTNDTGASHIAAAVGAPSVVMFGPSRPFQYAPLDQERHLAVDALHHLPAITDGGTALQQLAVQPVLDAALRQLARFDSAGGTAAPRERAVAGREAAWAG